MYQNHRIAKQLTLSPLNELVRVLKYKTIYENNITKLRKTKIKRSRGGDHPILVYGETNVSMK